MAPNQYAIGVAKNKFALFDSEEEIDPHELLKKQEKEREERKKIKVAEKSNPVKTTRKPNTNTIKALNNFKPSSEVVYTKETVKSRQSYPPAVKKPVTLSDNNQSVQKHSFEEPANYVYADRKGERGEHMDSKADGSSGSESGAAERGRGGRGGFSRVFVRGGGSRGRGFSYNRRNKELERYSGSDRTGVKPVDKPKYGGSHNWGNQQEISCDMEAPQEAPMNTEEQPIDIDKVESIESVKDDGQNATPPEEREKPALTLDEWKALKTTRPKPSYNIRQPGEGEDMSRWKKMYALSKKTVVEEDEEDYEYGEFPQRVGRQKRLEIDVCFNDRRGRGRGTFRGTPGRSYDSQPAAPAPKVDDESDFPSLVKDSN